MKKIYAKETAIGVINKKIFDMLLRKEDVIKEEGLEIWHKHYISMCDATRSFLEINNYVALVPSKKEINEIGVIIFDLEIDNDKCYRIYDLKSDPNKNTSGFNSLYIEVEE